MTSIGTAEAAPTTGAAPSPFAAAVGPQALQDALARIDAAPKSRKWKLRSRVGERMQWYVLPEEPQKAVDLREL